MAKSIENCKVIKERTYYYKEPKIINGKCEGFASSKKPYNTISKCKKCNFYCGRGD